MKLTCLSEGKGYHFPACHILDLCGFRILLDCPIDLSSLSAFAPVAAHLGKREADLTSCIKSVPLYKTVNTLHLFDPAFINVVLISSATGMLGLPFLTRQKSFSGKIYATDVTVKLGQLMMNELISMHREFRQLHGPEDSEWMKFEELEKMSPVLQEVLMGNEGTHLGGWLQLYATTEVKDCIGKIQPLRYGEEACYNGTLVMRAVSSGLEIGASNWAIKTPKLDVAYVTSSVFDSPQALDFDYQSLQAHDVVIYSDVSSFQNVEEDDEIEKLEFICSCAFDSLTANGSVLIPIGRLGVILNLLEQISVSSKLSALKVPIFIISEFSNELFSLLNVVPEWLSRKKQEKLFAGEPLFAHVDLLKEKRLHLISNICSPEVLNLWREPCIVICPHWSLRLGPAVHLLQRWRSDENSLLVLENNVDPDLTLLPFKPMKMKVLQCSFLSGIKSKNIVPLMETLKPKLAIFPKSCTHTGNPDSFSLLHYSENDTLRVPKLKMGLELELDCPLHGKTFKGCDANIGRLRGELSMYHGKQRLVLGKDSSCCSSSLLYWGTIDVGRLLGKLEEMGIHGVLDQGRADESVVVKMVEPCKGFIEVKDKSVVISTGDEKLASKLFEAIETTLDCI